MIGVKSEYLNLYNSAKTNDYYVTGIVILGNIIVYRLLVLDRNT